MSGIAWTHVFLIGGWAGCVAVEGVLELSARGDAALRAPVARFHDSIDRTFEVPLVLAVLATGLMQLDLGRLAQGEYALKVGAGLAAVLVNLLCVVPVVRRKRLAEQGAAPGALQAQTRLVLLAFKVGLPCGLLALYLGLRLSGIA